MVVLPQIRALPDSFFHVTFPKLSFFWIFFPLEYLEYLSIWQYFLWKTRALPDSFSIHGTFPKLFFFWIGTKFCTFRTSLWSLLMRGKIHKYILCHHFKRGGMIIKTKNVWSWSVWEVPAGYARCKNENQCDSQRWSNDNQARIKWAKDKIITNIIISIKW